MAVEATEDIGAYLAAQERKELLRFLTAGSVDDGKSTLIGRLLYDTQLIYEDQLAAVKRDSERKGTTGGAIDLSLLMDGLKAEREQGITIDVAYRYFSTSRRKFIIADCPGHEQYTRNMATGASNCDLAIILIDARHGVQRQTRRHSFIVSLLGIRHVVVAINKMDLVGWSESRFDEIRHEYADFATRLDMRDLRFIPLSALLGDNLVEPSAHMPWYQGETLLRLLETVHIASDRNLIDFRLPVQYVNRPNLDFRGFCGTVASGVVRQGDEVMVLPSGQRSRVKALVTYEGDVPQAFPPMAVTVVLEDEIDVSRGSMLVHPGEPAATRTDLRGDGRVDGRGTAGAGQGVSRQAHGEHRQRERDDPALPRGRQHAAPRAGDAAVDERRRALHDRGEPAAAGGPVPAQSRPGRVHPHRPDDQPDGRCRHGRGPPHRARADGRSLVRRYA